MEWVVAYDDGRIFRQNNEDGTEMLFKDIDQDRLLEFSLLTPDFNISVFPRDGKVGLFSIFGNKALNASAGFVFDFDTIKDSESGTRLVYFTRTRKILGPSGEDEKEYFLGLQATKAGINHIRLLKYFNGQVSIVDHK